MGSPRPTSSFASVGRALDEIREQPRREFLYRSDGPGPVSAKDEGLNPNVQGSQSLVTSTAAVEDGSAAASPYLSVPGIYVALFRDAPGMVGRLIRWQTRSRYSHAALVFDRAAIFSFDPNYPLLKQCEGINSALAHCSVHRHVSIEAREFRGVRIVEGVVKGFGTNVDLFAIQGGEGGEYHRGHRGADTEGTEEHGSAGASPHPLKTIWQFAKEQISKPYDYTMVARFVSRRAERRSSSGKWFCSELVFAALQKAGINLLRDVEPWAVSPGLLAKSPLLRLERTI